MINAEMLGRLLEKVQALTDANHRDTASLFQELSEALQNGRIRCDSEVEKVLDLLLEHDFD